MGNSLGKQIGYDYKISFIRCLAVVLILIIHIRQSFGLSNAGFPWFTAVPIFLMISGYLYGQKKIENVKKWLKNRIKKIIIPYYLLLIINSFIVIFFTNQFNFVEFLKGLLLFPSFKMSIFKMAHMWYMPYIIICYFITPLLERIFSKLHKMQKRGATPIILLLTMFAVLLITQLLSYIPFYGNLSSVQINIYIGAYYISKLKNDGRLKHNDILYFCIIGLLVAIILQFVIKLLPFNSFDVLAGLYKEGAVSYLFFGFLLFITSKINFKKTEKVWKISDKFSFYIYLTHYWFTKMGWVNTFGNIFLPLAIVTYFVLVALCTVLLYYLNEKIIYKYFLKKRGFI